MKRRSLVIFLCATSSFASFADTAVAPTAPTTQATPAPQTLPTMDCHYHFSKDMKTIDLALVKQWAEKAVVQSFDFNSTSIDNELLALKSCFTDQGWQGFDQAFNASGNLNAIKKQQLAVSSQLNGKASVQFVKDNQWKASLPLQVTYQNKEHKLVQALTVDLLISRKSSGDLGIMQLIAIPSKAPTAVPNNTSAS